MFTDEEAQHSLQQLHEFEDTKGITRNRKSKKNRQCIGQAKKDKKTHTVIYKTLYRKLHVEYYKPH